MICRNFSKVGRSCLLGRHSSNLILACIHPLYTCYVCTLISLIWPIVVYNTYGAATTRRRAELLALALY